jgi:RNA polymerase sigma-70 factor (ECF subfamily)
LNYATLDDETLMRLIAHASTEALDVLYDRYSRLVFSLALNAVGDHATAEEITQDVFFRVWEKANTYRVEQAKVSTWLTSITRYRAIDVLRRRSSRPEQNSVGWEDVSVNFLPASDDTPEDVVELRMTSARVQAAIISLPAEQQQALALAFFQGLSHSEIAEMLGQPLGTVKTRFRSGMQKLRKILKEEVGIDKP